MAQDGCHRLHHDFFRIKHAVHHNAKDIGAHLHHNNITLEATHRCLTQPQQGRQRYQRQQSIPQPQHRRILDHFNARIAFMLIANAHQFHHANLRNGEAFTTRLHNQRRDNRQRQRNLDGEGGAASFL